MEISGISSSIPCMFHNREGAQAAREEGIKDTVNIQGNRLLADDEVDGVLKDTVAMIGANRADALSAHSGLNESRVFALLGV